MATASSSSSQSSGRKRALLIGNNAYKQGRQLRCCINDANDLGNELRTIHFQVVLGTDLTYKQMDLTIEKFVREICPGDLVVFFFSGHGTQWNDLNFLLPIDDKRLTSRQMLKHGAVNAQATLQMIMDRSPSAAIFLLDCCRSYTMPDEVASKGPIDTVGLSSMKAVAGSFIAFACDADKTALDGAKNGRNGIFTAHLLECITQPNLTIDQMMYRVCDGVMTETKDTQCPFRISSLRREVYLNSTIQTDTSSSTMPRNPRSASHNMVAKNILPSIPPNARWTRNGVTIAGGHGRGSATNQLFYPWSLYVDDDQTILIADHGNHRIVEWKRGATSGQVVAGGNGKGNRTDQLDHPRDVIVDKETDSLIICDHGNRRVMRWSRRSGTSGEIIIENINCRGLTMDDERFLYISDETKHEVRRYRVGEKNGTVVAGGNGKGDRLNQLNWPRYVFVDRNHSAYVSDMGNHRVMKWVKGAKEGIVVAGGRGYGNDLTQLYWPRGVFVDLVGTVYVVEWGNHRVMRWCKGVAQGNVIVGGNGRGEQANQLYCPDGLSFDRHGNLYVADCVNHRVQRFSIEN